MTIKTTLHVRADAVLYLDAKPTDSRFKMTSDNGHPFLVARVLVRARPYTDDDSVVVTMTGPALIKGGKEVGAIDRTIRQRPLELVTGDPDVPLTVQQLVAAAAVAVSRVEGSGDEERRGLLLTAANTPA